MAEGKLSGALKIHLSLLTSLELLSTERSHKDPSFHQAAPDRREDTALDDVSRTLRYGEIRRFPAGRTSAQDIYDIDDDTLQVVGVPT